MQTIIIQDHNENGSPANEQDIKVQIEEFSDGTTFHGMKYACSPKNSLLKRILWWGFILGMTAALITTLSDSLIKYFKRESVTTTSLYLADKLALPSVTICRNSYINMKVLKSNYEEEIQNIIYHYFFPALERKSDYNQSISPGYVTDFLKQETILNFYKKSTSQNFFLNCKIGSQVLNCTEYLKTVRTDKGVCYIFHSKGYINLNNALVSTIAGPQEGLSFTMDVQPEEETFPLSLGIGLRVLIHDPKIFPLMEEKSFMISPGKEIYASIRKAESRFLQLPYSIENCILDEDLPVYNERYGHPELGYSSEYCYIQCSLNMIYEKFCNCTYLGSGQDSCTLFHVVSCGLQHLNYYNRSDILQTCSYCLPICHEINYELKLSSMDFPNSMAERYAESLNYSYKTKKKKVPTATLR